MNTTYELWEPGATSAPADDLGDVTGLPHWATTRDEPVMAVSETSEREEVLALLVQRIGELPTATKKILALYYQENFPLSESLFQFIRTPDPRNPFPDARITPPIFR